jgi:hypothetical protein
LQIPSATEVEFLYQKQLSKGSSGTGRGRFGSIKEGAHRRAAQDEGIAERKMTNAAGEGAERYFGKSRG